MNDQFIKIPFRIDTLDRYFIRKAILRALKENFPSLTGALLDVGCGKMPYKSIILQNTTVTTYTGLDIENALVYDAAVRPDYTWDGVTMPLSDAAYDCALGTEVLEHCFDPEILLNEVYRVLKPGGVFFFTVPFLWNLHEVPHDAYRYTPFALERKLREAGFKDIKIQGYGGWNSALAQMLGLWVRRAPMHRFLRLPLSVLLLPCIWILIKTDERTFGHTNFEEPMMVPGLYGKCIK